MTSDPRSTVNLQAPRSRIHLLIFLLAGISLLGLALRVWQLELRPLHHDEANQAVRTGILLETGEYRYDPADHHGPSLYYLSLPLAWLTAGRDFSKTTELTFRLVPAVFGAALVPLLFFLRRSFTIRALAFSGFLTAISPAMVYFGRFYIQETLLVVFTFGAIILGWLYLSRPSATRAFLTGTCLGLMFATKETSVLAYLSMAAGLAAVAVTDRVGTRRTLSAISGRHLAWLTLGAVAVATAFFSSFFTHPDGLLDIARSFHIYLSRGFSESLHLHPWYFYLKSLLYTHDARGPVWSEGFILALAAVGIGLAWLGSSQSTGDSRLVRFLSVYTVVLVLAYSAIPHKTPWSMLSFHHGLILLAGFGAAALLDAGKGLTRYLTGFLLAAGFLHLTWLSAETNFRYFADPRNPYVYSQTSPDFLNLVRRVDQIAAVAPEGRGMLIEVITDPYSSWPLPWYLRDFSRVGYWEDAAQVPDDPVPAIIVTTPEMEPRISGKLGDRFRIEFYGLRPSVFLLVCIRDDLWQRFLQAQAQQHAASH